MAIAESSDNESHRAAIEKRGVGNITLTTVFCIDYSRSNEVERGLVSVNLRFGTGGVVSCFLDEI